MNKILILHDSDLIERAKDNERTISDVRLDEFKGSMQPIEEAEFVAYEKNGLFIILKTKDPYTTVGGVGQIPNMVKALNRTPLVGQAILDTNQ